MSFRSVISVSAMVLSLSLTSFAIAADDKDKAAAVTDEDGKYFDADGNPTFKIEEDGAVDWYTFSGYRRYHSDCHVCHGPDGVGSSYAPALADSMKNMDYGTFLSIVAEGRKNVGGRKGKRHAGIRRQQERLLLHGRSLRLFASSRRRRDSTRQTAQKGGQASGGQRPRNVMHGWIAYVGR